MRSEPVSPVVPDKAQAVLLAALDVFARYGFRRSAMEDIARAAGMSRPALYQHFRNKEDIARSLVALYFDMAVTALETGLSCALPPAEALERAFLGMAGQFKETLLDSPHGAELLDMGDTVAPDLVRAGMARKADVLAEWLRREAQAGRLRLEDPPEILAQVMLAALDGAKTPPFALYRDRLKALARLFGRGLSSGAGAV